MIGKVLRVGDQGYRKLDQPPPDADRALGAADSRSRPAPAVVRPRCASTTIERSRAGRSDGKQRKIGVPTPKASTMSGSGGQPPPPSLAVREVIRGRHHSAGDPIGRLSDIELGWLFAAGLFALDQDPRRAGDRRGLGHGEYACD